MLDPGHGGIDTGAIGHNGSKKHVVLAIAKNVRSILRNNGIDARLTRSGDTLFRSMTAWRSPTSTAPICLCQFTLMASPTERGRRLRFRPLNRGASSAMAKYLSDRENRADEVAGKKTTDKDHLLQQVLFDLVQTDTIKTA